MKKYKDFETEQGFYFIDSKPVSKGEFNARRLKECFHQWRPLGCHNIHDGFCIDCLLMVVKGKKVLK